MAEMYMIQAIHNALEHELKKDHSVLVFGEDVGVNGGVFRATEGLQEKFGKDRVFDTPLAESGIGGLALGLGIGGFRSVIEIQFLGFIFEAMDVIANQMARIRYRSAGVYHAPITIRSPFGGGVKTPELHGDSLEGILAQVPGLKVVMPSTPYDAKGLLLSAIRDNDPVIFLEHMKLYRSFRQEVPEEEYLIPIGKADIKCVGTDVSIITYGAMVHTSLEAAENLAKRGISAEVVDLRTISPFDIETIVNSVWKTKRAIIVQESQRQSGIAGRVISEIQERAITRLEAPILQVTPVDTIFPFPQAEEIWLPKESDIVKKVLEVIEF
jgi:pyruvate dehydrogenase E1 component beta subunit